MDEKDFESLDSINQKLKGIVPTIKKRGIKPNEFTFVSVEDVVNKFVSLLNDKGEDIKKYVNK